jgi:hypothetical protein
MPEEMIEITTGENELLIKGIKRRSGIPMEHEITLPMDEVEFPEDDEWKPLPDEFGEASETVRQCASQDENFPAVTCVHITKRFLEACDNYQMSRYRLRTGFENEALIRGSSIIHVGTLTMNEFAEKESWVHFRNPTWLILSCRRYAENFPDLNPVLEVNGTITTLPQGMEAAADMARIFSSSNAENDQIEIRLRKNKLIVVGEGTSGWYKESSRIQYTGPDLAFRIAPNLLKEAISRSLDCELGNGRLKISVGRLTYVTTLCIPTADDEDSE